MLRKDPDPTQAEVEKLYEMQGFHSIPIESPITSHLV